VSVVFHVPLERAATPVDGRCVVARWWAMHPAKGLAFCAAVELHRVDDGDRRAAPQCHSDEALARLLSQRLYPGHDVVFVPVVFLTHAAKVARELSR
jgi:hypothetical protein